MVVGDGYIDGHGRQKLPTVLIAITVVNDMGPAVAAIVAMVIGRSLVMRSVMVAVFWRI